MACRGLSLPIPVQGVKGLANPNRAPWATVGAAKALGLDLPLTLLATADDLIE